MWELEHLSNDGKIYYPWIVNKTTGKEFSLVYGAHYRPLVDELNRLEKELYDAKIRFSPFWENLKETVEELQNDLRLNPEGLIVTFPVKDSTQLTIVMEILMSEFTNYSYKMQSGFQDGDEKVFLTIRKGNEN